MKSIDKFKLNRKGFTLVELLVTILLISIFMVFAVSYFKGDLFNGKFSEAKSKDLFLDAASDYAKEFSNEIIKDDNGDETSFCVSVESLKAKGYYKSNSKIDDNTVIKVTIKNGVYNTMVANNDSECPSVYKLKDSSGKIDIYDNGVDIGDFNYTINDSNNSGTLNISYDFNLDGDDKGTSSLNVNSSDKSLYIMVVLDNSISMMGSKLANASLAIVNLSNNIINNYSNSKIGLIQYATRPYLTRGFEHSVIPSYVDFFGRTRIESDASSGSTNTASGLDGAIYTISQENIANSDIYTIVLYDGDPNGYPIIKTGSHLKDTIDATDSGYFNKINNFSSFDEFRSSLVPHQCSSISSISDNNCVTYLNSSASYLKNNLNSKFITIGYRMHSIIDLRDNRYNNLKKISSIDNSLCNNSDYSESGNNYCYYDGDEGNISKIFNDIGTSIISKLSASNVILSADSNVSNGLYNTFIVSNANNLSFANNYVINAKELNSSCSDDKCSVSLFNNGKITLNYDNSNSKNYTIDIDKLVVNFEKTSTIN